MSYQTTSLDARHIEFDGLAIVLLAGAFALVACGVALVVGSAAQRMDGFVIIASALVATGVIAGWILGYPRHAAIPCMSLAFICAILLLPFFFDMNGVLLRDAGGAPPSRVYIAMGLYVGGLGVLFLAFIVFGFVVPLVGAVLRAKRGEPQARATLLLHLALGGVAIALTLGVRLLL